jgi:MFS transporter, FHS family, L-fucose permease
VAQFFYIGAQITCWTFIIQHGTEVLMGRGLGESEAEVAAQGYNIIAMIIFAASRFICTLLLRFFRPGALLLVLALGGFVLVLGAILVPGIGGLYSLVGVSACMSLMFPTIYGIALTGLGDDAKIGAAGLIMAILGGSILPPLQAMIMDGGAIHLGPLLLSSIRASFVIPLLCFVVVALFGWRAMVAYRQPGAVYREE